MGLTLLGGCQLFTDDADREVYRLIERRQQAAVGETRDARIDKERSPATVDDDPYSFAPHPIDSEVPGSFSQSSTRPAVTSRPADTAPTDSAATQPAREMPAGPELSLADALSYAFRHSRSFQTAKEDLYLAALDLSLERHMWTPRLMGEIRSQYANYGQTRDFDHAMEAVAEVGVEQQLPYGGEVTARVINTLMRDLGHRITTGETGKMILEANIPLLRGAGRVAYESRYQSERELVYAVRAFERFRRELAVRIAGTYFNLQRLRQEILNARQSAEAFTNDAARADGLARTGRVNQLDVFRADQNRLTAIATEVDAIERYRTALDEFKIRLGMPTERDIQVELPADDAQVAAEDGNLQAETLEQALRMPAVPESEALRVGLKYRLDLLNDSDRIDDANRGVKIAENGLLPDLTASGTVTMDTHPDELGVLKYNTKRTTWRGYLSLELPLDRKAERNALRSSQIGVRRAQRDYEESRDIVRLEVRRAIRRVDQQAESLEIQRLNRDVAVIRRRAADIQYDLGKIGNRDVVEAQEELLEAQNRFAQAQAQFRLAILEFRLATGTLRIDDAGRWTASVANGPGAR